MNYTASIFYKFHTKHIRNCFGDSISEKDVGNFREIHYKGGVCIVPIKYRIRFSKERYYVQLKEGNIKPFDDLEYTIKYKKKLYKITTHNIHRNLLCMYEKDGTYWEVLVNDFIDVKGFAGVVKARMERESGQQMQLINGS